jgi:D-threonate/D-erythronate kinase
MKIGIAADDLTSATDGAAPFVTAGHACAVAFDHRFAPALIQDVLSIDKDSRQQRADEAARRAEAVARKLASADVLYHTIDSTIRGHIEAEVLAALKASGRKAALFAPAFPEAGRTTVGGEQLLNGKPMNMSIYGLDPIHPVKEHRIRKRFPSLQDAAVRHIALTEVRALKPGSFSTPAEQLVIADAERQGDLDALVAAVASPSEVLFCGSPGMARALATRFTGLRPVALDIPTATLVLTVIGSANTISISQKRMLILKERAVEIVVDAKAASASPNAAARAAIDKAKPLFAGATSLVVGTSLVERSGVDAHKITEAVGQAVAELIRALPIDGLVLTGGDTAAAVFRAMMLKEIKLSGELEPGIPIGLIESPRRMGVITKAGGFGTMDTLSNAAARLRGQTIGAAA